MELSKEKQDRLKAVALVGFAAAKGSAALKKDIREETRIKTVHFWEASKEVWVELIDDGTLKAIKLVSRIAHGPGGWRDNPRAETIDGPEEFSEAQIVELEEAFPSSETEDK
jgi:hypothetical protein